MSAPYSFKLYRFLTSCSSIIAPTFLKWRSKHQKEIASRENERLGQPTISRPEGELIWLHGASIGESLSLLSLIQALEKPGRRILLTYGTVNAMLALQDRLPPTVLQQFLPFDLPAPVKRFLVHWKPDLAIFAESEIWPNFIYELKSTRAVIGVINGRLSKRSFYIWSLLHGTARWLMEKFDFCLCQTESDATRYRKMGAKNAKSVGNLKFDSPPLPFDAPTLMHLRQTTKERKILLAVSLHIGEEIALAEAVETCRAKMQNVLAIIVPRHPERAMQMKAFFESRNFRVALRSEAATPPHEADIYLANTIGETGLFYRLAPIAFIGGSLTKIGGHNPIEPAQLSVGVLHGPHVSNFSQIYDDLHALHAARKVSNGKDLGAAFLELTQDEKKRKELQENSAVFISRFTGALARTIEQIEICSQRRKRA